MVGLQLLLYNHTIFTILAFFKNSLLNAFSANNAQVSTEY